MCTSHIYVDIGKRHVLTTQNHFSKVVFQHDVVLCPRFDFYLSEKLAYLNTSKILRYIKPYQRNVLKTL